MTAIFYRGDRANTGFFYRSRRPSSDRSELAALVQSIVAEVDWNRPGPDGREGRVWTVRCQIMLAVLTYCYALGIYRASDIETALVTGQVNVGAVEGAPVDRHTLIQFRRNHRDLLAECLKKVLLQLNDTPTPRSMTDSAAGSVANSAAQSRIDRAIEWDCMDRDQ
jgi:hypothetical protein